MLRVVLAAISLGFFIVSCKLDDREFENLIPLGDMACIVSEVFKTEGILSIMKSDSCINSELMIDSIFIRFNTTKELFEKSMQHYSKNMEEYSQIYDSAYNIIRIEQDTLRKTINNK